MHGLHDFARCHYPDRVFTVLLGTPMKKTIELPTKIDVPTGVVKQQTGFGDASEYHDLAAEYYRMESGTDMTPLLEGQPEDLCQVPHWGYLLAGTVTVTYTDGTEEVNTAGDVYYWPPGHTLRVDEDVEAIVFSPSEHETVLDHMLSKMGR